MVDGSTTRNPLVADYSEWRARDYFQTYYSEVVLPDEQAVLAYQIDVLRAARARFGRGLEYGCGPTLHRAIAAAKYAFRIDMADWLADNLAEAREWLCADDSAPEWKRFTRYVLACEGQSQPSNSQRDPARGADPQGGARPVRERRAPAPAAGPDARRLSTISSSPASASTRSRAIRACSAAACATSPRCCSPAARSSSTRCTSARRTSAATACSRART